jgi:hypothetical protein
MPCKCPIFILSLLMYTIDMLLCSPPPCKSSKFEKHWSLRLFFNFYYILWAWSWASEVKGLLEGNFTQGCEDTHRSRLGIWRVRGFSVLIKDQIPYPEIEDKSWLYTITTTILNTILVATIYIVLLWPNTSLSSSHILTYLMLKTTLWNKYYEYPHSNHLVRKMNLVLK